MPLYLEQPPAFHGTKMSMSGKFIGLPSSIIDLCLKLKAFNRESLTFNITEQWTSDNGNHKLDTSRCRMLTVDYQDSYNKLIIYHCIQLFNSQKP